MATLITVRTIPTVEGTKSYEKKVTQKRAEKLLASSLNRKPIWELVSKGYKWDPKEKVLVKESKATGKD